MLTNTDLSKIRAIVSEEAEVKLKPVNKQLDRIEKKLIVSFDHLDRRLIDHDKRLDRVDNHLHFDPIPQTPPSKYIQRLQSQLAH